MLAMKQEGQLDYIDENEEWRKIEEVMASLDANLLNSFSINNNKKRNNNIDTNNLTNDNNLTYKGNASNTQRRVSNRNKKADDNKRLSIECSNAAYNINNFNNNNFNNNNLSNKFNNNNLNNNFNNNNLSNNINNNINNNNLNNNFSNNINNNKHFKNNENIRKNEITTDQTLYLHQAHPEEKLRSVEEWLSIINLPHLLPTFLSHGFDHLSFMGCDTLNASDLDSMGVNIEHHHVILYSLSLLPTIRFNPQIQSTATIHHNHPTFFVSVVEWLMWLRLPHLINSFQKHRHTAIHHLFTITPIQLTSVFGVSKLGNINRINASIHFLTNVNKNKNNNKNNSINRSSSCTSGNGNSSSSSCISANGNSGSSSCIEDINVFRISQKLTVNNKSEFLQENIINRNKSNNKLETIQACNNKSTVNTTTASNNNNNLETATTTSNKNNTATTATSSSCSLRSVISEEERLGLDELLKECEVFSDLFTDDSNTTNNKSVSSSNSNNLYTKCKSEDGSVFMTTSHSSTHQTTSSHSTIYATTPRLKHQISSTARNNSSTTSLYSSLKLTSSSQPSFQSTSQPTSQSPSSQQPSSFQAPLSQPSSSLTTPSLSSTSVTAQSSSSLLTPSSSSSSSSFPTSSSSSSLPTTSSFSSSSSLQRPAKIDSIKKVFRALYMGSIKLHCIDDQELARHCIQQIRQQEGQEDRQRESYLTVSNNRVSFLDAASKELLGLHSVASIFCVCQDQTDLEYFSFVTFDLLDHVHFCHVFQAQDVDKSTEIVLAMAEAFEQAFSIIQQQQLLQQKTSQQLPQQSLQQHSQPQQVHNSHKQQETTSNKKLNLTLQNQQLQQKQNPKHQQQQNPQQQNQQQQKQQQLQQHSNTTSNSPIFEETAILT